MEAVRWKLTARRLWILALMGIPAAVVLAEPPRSAPERMRLELTPSKVVASGRMMTSGPQAQAPYAVIRPASGTSTRSAMILRAGAPGSESNVGADGAQGVLQAAEGTAEISPAAGPIQLNQNLEPNQSSLKIRAPQPASSPMTMLPPALPTPPALPLADQPMAESTGGLEFSLSDDSIPELESAAAQQTESVPPVAPILHAQETPPPTLVKPKTVAHQVVQTGTRSSIKVPQLEELMVPPPAAPEGYAATNTNALELASEPVAPPSSGFELPAQELSGASDLSAVPPALTPVPPAMEPVLPRPPEPRIEYSLSDGKDALNTAPVPATLVKRKPRVLVADACETGMTTSKPVVTAELSPASEPIDETQADLPEEITPPEEVAAAVPTPKSAPVTPEKPVDSTAPIAVSPISPAMLPSKSTAAPSIRDVQTPEDRLPADAKKIAEVEMRMGETRSLQCSGVTKVLAENTVICDAAAVGGTIFIVPKQPGTCRIAVWQANGTANYLELRVVNNAVTGPESGAADQLQAMIQQRFKTPGVKVTNTDSGLVVHGVVPTAQHAREIMMMVRSACLCPVTDKLQSQNR